MRIVNLSEFLTLPAGTVFAKFEPDIFGETFIKEGTCGVSDFFYSDLSLGSVDANSSDELHSMIDRAATAGASLPMDFDIVSRAGMFDDGQLFAVLERRDVEAMIERLSRTLTAVTEMEMP